MNKEDIINTLIVMGIMIILIVLMCMIGVEKDKAKCDDTLCYINKEYKPDIKVQTDEDGTTYVLVNGEE